MRCDGCLRDANVSNASRKQVAFRLLRSVNALITPHRDNVDWRSTGYTLLYILSSRLKTI